MILAALVGISALAWAYMLYLAWAMRSMSMDPMDMGLDQAMPQMQAWGATDLVLTFVMWTIMMVAMMVPSAAPMILLFATINRKRRQQERPYVATSVFLLGYLVIWALFSGPLRTGPATSVSNTSARRAARAASWAMMTAEWISGGR